MTPVPVLEIGGTHVTAALVDPATGLPVAGRVVRAPVSSGAGAVELLDSFAAAAHRIQAPVRADWGVALPGPFDYANGIGRFRGIGKFESLHGVDVGEELLRRLPDARTLTFLNDADAFAIGEHLGGAAEGHDRSVCVTLGTGVGSSFLSDGRPVTEDPRVPPEGRAHRIFVDGLPLEEAVSRRAIRRRYARAAGLTERAGVPDVGAIADLARQGESAAAAAISESFRLLGRALAPWCVAFRPGVMVVGGSMAASWDLIGPALREGLAQRSGEDGPGGVLAEMALCPAARPEEASLIGAAHWARRAAAGSGRPWPAAEAAGQPSGTRRTASS
ncbi:ROK family protein [Streptomyces sp. NPDC049916]|uniref:ROK family protein n=1 Tax=Streptomyces sp. NPDC049916 TaxID=3155156 RepID=UPI00342D72D9